MEKFRYRHSLHGVLLLNIGCFIISFIKLLSISRYENGQSLHGQSLVDHYYLVNFNAKEATFRSKQLIADKNLQLYLCDDFGGTGINYYLQAFGVSYKTCSDSLAAGTCIIIANNKKNVEQMLQLQNISYKKIFDSNNQYNIYYCTGNNAATGN